MLIKRWRWSSIRHLSRPRPSCRTTDRPPGPAAPRTTLGNSRQPSAVKSIAHNSLRQTPSPINLAACQEATDGCFGVPWPAVPVHCTPAEPTAAPTAQKRRPAGRLAVRCRLPAGATTATRRRPDPRHAPAHDPVIDHRNHHQRQHGRGEQAEQQCPMSGGTADSDGLCRKRVWRCCDADQRGLPYRCVLTRFRQYPGRLEWCAKATTINSEACSRTITAYGNRLRARRFARRLPATPGTGLNGTSSSSRRSSAASTAFRNSMPSPPRWRSYHAAASAPSSAAASRTLTERFQDSRSGCVSVGAVLPGRQGLPCLHRVGRGAAESLYPTPLMHRRRRDHQGWPEGHGRALPAR